ncbi:DUF6816 family protein [Prochlorococcus marinus]|uniref:POLO box duplicated region n=1 Tax=Prochlorococcus marinus XMU1408 TaxID=2213228 RepID=A0A318R7V2_PROMR|nr:POLO box duplicated region [Prochlorococcus marinus]MBW3041172.1 POLO box duplicated region [Prochlorococcus marinus str. XMU1408]PYE03770.1 POLO box duplicated region [Prochlorococcus marinus XMU1408]
MRQKFFLFLVSILIIFTYTGSVLAETIIETNNFQPSKLSERKSNWPDWRLPFSIKRPGLKDDLIYPDWFEGVWDVTSVIEGGKNNNKNQEPIIHSAKFIHNTSGNLIADREYNTNSYALSSKTGGFLSVKNDPKSPNRQVAKLTEDRYLETKIIGRLQEKINNNIFITDELILQILHTPEFSRVSQVETLTEFKKCRSNQNNEINLSDFNICGEQFQAIYNQPGQNVISLPIKTEKSKLLLRKTNDG